MVTTIRDHDPATILSRAIAPEIGDWPKDIARGFLSIKIAPDDLDRMNALAKLAQSGELSPTEHVEIENYRKATSLLDLLKAKARVSLAQAGSRI